MISNPLSSYTRRDEDKRDSGNSTGTEQDRRPRILEQQSQQKEAGNRQGSKGGFEACAGAGGWFGGDTCVGVGGWYGEVCAIISTWYGSGN
jgi:hypothetical protein